MKSRCFGDGLDDKFKNEFNHGLASLGGGSWGWF